MRNLFDQYSQPENRLTHALITALHEDRSLLRSFLRDIAGTEPDASARSIELCEQVYPGSVATEDVELDETEKERRGIPDAWMTSGEEWCLLIENKVLSRISIDQLNRHIRTARRLGYRSPHVLVLAIHAAPAAMPNGVRVIEWRSLYRWLLAHSSDSTWAKRVAEYLELMEAQMVEREQMVSGTLTAFAGFDFGPDRPLTALEGKRVLKLAMEELRRRKDLRSALGVDPRLPGRGLIKGQNRDFVWDVLQFDVGVDRAGNELKQHPHLTLGFGRTHVDVMLTVPNDLRPVFRQRLDRLDLTAFRRVVGDVRDEMRPLIRKCPGAQPRLRIQQRHWESRSGPPTNDALIEVDLRTGADGHAPVRKQPQWIDMVHAVLSQRRSNLELQIGAIFPYRTCPAIRTVKSLDLVAAAWIACNPLVSLLTPGDSKPKRTSND